MINNCNFARLSKQRLVKNIHNSESNMGKSFLSSRHTWDYIVIAIKHFTTPQRVYDLAHGIKKAHEKDSKIMHDLIEAGIIHHRHSSHSSHHRRHGGGKIMSWKRFIPFTSCLLMMSTLLSCDNKKGNEQELAGDDVDIYTNIADLVSDSVEGEKVSKECAVVCYKIDQVTEEVASVNSPEALITAKQSFKEEIAEAGSGIKELDGEEQALANRHVQEAEEEFSKACREYEVPASGVIANLKDLIKRIDKVKTKRELDSFQDCRLGMLMNLDNIHLCVDSKSTKIKEVKTLAQTLKSKWEAKKKEISAQRS